MERPGRAGPEVGIAVPMEQAGPDQFAPDQARRGPTPKERRRGRKQPASKKRPAASSLAVDTGTIAIPSAFRAEPGTTTLPRPDTTAPAPAPRPGRRAGGAPRRGLPVKTVAGAFTAALMAGTAFLILIRSSHGTTQAHVLTTPASLGCFTQEPQLAQQMQAKQLQQQILSRSKGTAKNVIYAVYECSGTSDSGQVILFIGGNLSGASPSSFISGFESNLQGATSTSAGSLGGDAACAPSQNGHPAVCAWADNDTFGAFVSANVSSSGLAADMRQMRPAIERPARPAGK
jgi:hypothetical protein